jgi:hypothetical protein
MAGWGAPLIDGRDPEGDADGASSEETPMDHARFFIQPAPEIAPDAQRVRIECVHGRTFGLVLAGATCLPDPVTLELLAVRHGSAYRCACSTVLRPGAGEVWIGASPAIVAPVPIAATIHQQGRPS